MFEISATQLWSGLFFFEAPPSVGELAARKGSALFPEGDDLLNISMGFPQKRLRPPDIVCEPAILQYIDVFFCYWYCSAFLDIIWDICLDGTAYIEHRSLDPSCQSKCSNHWRTASCLSFNLQLRYASSGASCSNLRSARSPD